MELLHLHFWGQENPRKKRTVFQGFCPPGLNRCATLQAGLVVVTVLEGNMLTLPSVRKWASICKSLAPGSAADGVAFDPIGEGPVSFGMLRELSEAVTNSVQLPTYSGNW